MSKEWIKNHRPGISPFGEKVADLLGELFKGIYHISDEVLHKRVDWSSDRFIEVVIGGGLATYDFDGLTQLVLLCHRDCIRCEIAGASSRYLTLSFSPRERTGSTMERHPDIHEAIAKLIPAGATA